jgi:hypothetical protein
MNYRVAIQVDSSLTWQWKSTVLSSLNTLLQVLRLYRSLPQDRLRVFSSSSRESLEEQLVQENQGHSSPSVTAAHFLQERLNHLAELSGGNTTTREKSVPGDGIHGDWHPIIGVRELHGNTRSRDARKDTAIMSFAELYNSVTSIYAFDTRSMSVLERRRLELELGPGGDHDVPHSFVLPPAMPQVLAWMRLLARIQRGELQP